MASLLITCMLLAYRNFNYISCNFWACLHNACTQSGISALGPGLQEIHSELRSGRQTRPLLIMGQAYSWCCETFSVWRSRVWANIIEGRDKILAKVFRMKPFNSRMKSLEDGQEDLQPTKCKSPKNVHSLETVKWNIPYYKEEAVGFELFEPGTSYSTCALKSLKLAPVAKSQRQSELRTKCPFTSNHSFVSNNESHENITIVSCICNHNGGVITSKDGIKLTVPKGAIKNNDLVTFYIAVGLYGPFVLPKRSQTDVVSPYYWIGVSGSYHFHKPVQVEFEHFGACDPSHYQLLSCKDDDESYTMRPVDYDLKFQMQIDNYNISLCSFQTYHCCSWCLHHNYKDANINMIGAFYLKPNDGKDLRKFSLEIWFSLVISYCLDRNEELYKKRCMILEGSYQFYEVSTDKNSTDQFILEHEKIVNDWCISSQNTEIPAKIVNFHNYFRDKKNVADLKASEEKMLFPPRFILHVRWNTESVSNVGLDTDIIITLQKKCKKATATKQCIFHLFVSKFYADTKCLSNESKDSTLNLPDHMYDCNKTVPTLRELITYEIPREWRYVALNLRVHQSRIGIIDINNVNDEKKKCYDMFEYWLQTNPSACWCYFRKALIAVNRHDLAEKVTEHLKRSLNETDLVESPDITKSDIKDIDVNSLKMVLQIISNRTSSDSLQNLFSCLLQGSTADVITDSDTMEEKIQKISNAFVKKQNPSWTKVHIALMEANCVDFAEYVGAQFLPLPDSGSHC